MPRKYQPAGVCMTPSKTKLGSFIRARRLKLNMRQVRLANQARTSQVFVSRIEIGRRKYLNDGQLKRFARTLQYDQEELRKRMPIKQTAQPKTKLGKLIRSRRKELNLSLSAFAKKMRMTLKKAKDLEMKKSPTIRYGLVKPLARALDLDVSVFTKFVGMRSKQTKSELGQLIRRRRKELGMNIYAFSKKLHVTPSFVSQIELGRCGLSESDEMIKRLAQILKLDVKKLQALRPKRKLKQIKTTSPLGRFLVAKRLKLQLSQAQVAQRAAITNPMMSKIEKGKHRPGRIVLGRLSKALKCNIPTKLVPKLRAGGRKK